MKALVLYDSYFGNTETIAQTIAAALGSTADVTVVKVSAATPEQLTGLDLLFVGSPTRGFQPSEALVPFLKSLPSGSLAGVKVGVFDTRIALEDMKPAALRFAAKIGGYADKKIAALLKPTGAEVILPSGGFLVAESEGPLKDGEIERAADWAKQIAAGMGR